jgi:hypothetical protein
MQSCKFHYILGRAYSGCEPSGALASVLLGQSVVTFGHISGLDFQDQKLTARRDDDEIVFAKALLLALHARPGQVVKYIKAVVQALLQDFEYVAFAVSAQMGGGLKGKAGVNAGHARFCHA